MIRAGGPAADRAVDVAVVGGGVIGCSVAYHAARRGASVALFEAESLGSGASGAAAGMLNAQAEAREPGPLLDLMLRSRELHRPLSEVLLQTTSVDPEHEWRGTLRVALDEGFVRQLRRTFDWQKEAGLAASWLSGEEAQELEPGLSPKARAGLYLPHDGQVEPSRLVRALALGATRHGADLFEGEPVTELLSMGGRKTGLVTGRIAGLRTSRRSVAAGSVVLAGGWSSGLLAAKLGLKLPLHPVQGETLTLREVEGSPAPLRKNVWDALLPGPQARRAHRSRGDRAAAGPGPPPDARRGSGALRRDRTAATGTRPRHLRARLGRPQAHDPGPAPHTRSRRGGAGEPALRHRPLPQRRPTRAGNG